MKLSKWLKADGAAAGSNSFVLPLELEDARPVKIQRTILRTGSIVLLAATLWAGVTPIRELAIAPGQIVPRGDIRAVQHLEGGIIAELYVTPGALVKAGDPLLRLASGQAGGDLGQLRARSDDLRQQQKQLEQLILSQKEGAPLRLEGIDLGAEQQAVLDTRMGERTSEHRTLKSRIEQRNVEVANLEKETKALEGMVAIRQQVFDDKADLLKQGLATRRDYYNDQSNLEQAKTQLLNSTGKLASAREALDEANSLLAASDAKAQLSWTEELSKVAADLKETDEALAKQQDRFNRLIVRAPVSGTVQVLTVKSVGEVIMPGDTFARIVPEDVPLVAEVQVRPDDIGNIKIGDRTELRITAFDSSIYGKIHGKVESISPSSFQRENGDFYFKAAVSLDEVELPGHAMVSPGMVVSAEIVIGAKSFLRYILKPLFKVYGPAFSER
ncbi:MAG: HlyD family type I secretion periplasmic adaptor subunit [Aestuariivirga sp.]